MAHWLALCSANLAPDEVIRGILYGAVLWFFLRYVIFGFFTVDQNERAVVSSFGRAQRILGANTTFTPEGEGMRPDEKERYSYPQLRVLPPGGPYFRWPWQQVHKVSIATRTLNMAYDPDDPSANYGGRMLEAVTKDQLNVGLTGQIRYKVSEANLYPFLFGVKRPISHIMGFFISILRERIASFEAKRKDDLPSTGLSIDAGVSINDLRKNLRDLNEHMDREAGASAGRYGILLEASLITGIDPPAEVESALAAINTAHNQVASDISLARAAADQKIVQSRRAVEIETLKAQAEVEPLVAMSKQLRALNQSGPAVLENYQQNLRLGLYAKAEQIFEEVKP